MTNGEIREATGSYSATESDSETVVLFNLDRLNDNRPKWLCGNAWERDQIPESTNGLNNHMVNSEERDRLRVAVGSVKNGPSFISISGSTQYQSPIQNMYELHSIPNLVQLVTLIWDWMFLGIQRCLRQLPVILLLLRLRLILAFVVLPKRDLVLSLARLGGTLGRNCFVGLCPRKVVFTPLSIKIVHIIPVIL